MSYRKPYKKQKAYKKKPQPKKYQNKNLEKRITKLEHSEELKYNDWSDGTTLTALGFAHHLTGLSQGDDYNQRIGEEIIAKYLNLKLRYQKTTASANYSTIRCLVFWDMQNNGTGPTVFTTSDLAQGVLDDTTIGSIFLCPHNYRTKERYHILMDKVLVMNPNATDTKQEIFYKKNIKLSGAKIKYSNSSGGYASVTSRALWILILADATTASEVTPVNSARFWYTDA